MDSLTLDPERGMKVTMMLADAAQVADGKLYIMGGGWNVTGPMAVPFAIALMVEVPWHLTNRPHAFTMEVIDLDGNAVSVDTPNGQEPVRFEGNFEVGRPPGVRSGSLLPFMAAINSGPIPWPCGSHFEWRLTIDGQTHEDWRLAFGTRPEAQSNAA